MIPHRATGRKRVLVILKCDRLRSFDCERACNTFYGCVIRILSQMSGPNDAGQLDERWEPVELANDDLVAWLVGG